MSDEQPRAPRGSATAGQWVSIPRDTGIELPGRYEITEAEENMRGSYDFPPRPRSADHAIRFWTNVDISDETLRQVSKDFSRSRSHEIDGIRERARREFNSNRALRKECKKLQPPILTDYDYASREAYRDMLRQAALIDPHDIRSVLIATRMSEEARRFLPPQELQKVLEYRLPLGSMIAPDGSTSYYTVDKIVSYFNLRRSIRSLQSPGVQSAETSREILAAIDPDAATNNMRDRF